MVTEIQLHYFKEFKVIDYRNLENIFTANQMIELLKNNVIKPFKNCNSKFYFNYVGIICTGKSICIILPKYLSDEELETESKNKNKKQSKTRLLIELLKIYFKKNRNINETYFSSIGEEEITHKVNKFALYDFLLLDYIEYGLYENHKEIYDFNGEGETDWEKTINECDSYLTGGKKPVYLKYFTQETEADNSNYIKKLHKYYLNLASYYFKNINFLGLDYPKINFSIDEDLGNLEFQIFRIYNELQGQYSERKIRLLKTLLILLENESHETEKSLSFYGTTAFYNVWEKACGTALGDQYKNYANYISKPEWKDWKGNSLKSNFKTIIPDILVLKEDIFYIFDAKYYRPDMEEIKGLPGMDSIGKQYLYELAFLNHPSLKNKSRRNIFLVPSSGLEIKYDGNVSVGFMKKIGDIELQDILIFKLPAERVFDLYIKNANFSHKEYSLFKV